MRKIAVLAALTLAAWGAQAAQAAYTVSVNFLPDVIVFDPAQPTYCLFPYVNVSGYTDSSHAGNAALITSGGDQSFSGHSETAGSGASSAGYSSVADLVDHINAGTGWTLDITDGATGIVSHYTLTVTTSGMTADTMRPITPNQFPNTNIAPNTTFSYTVDPAADPGNSYDSAFGGIIGQDANNSYFPTLDPSITSFTAPFDLNPDSYILLFALVNEDPDQSLFSTTIPSPLDDAEALDGFSSSVRIQSETDIYGLVVAVPEPAALGILPVAGLLLGRRPRR